MISKRRKITKDGGGSEQDLVSNNQDILVSMVAVRQIYRHIHRKIEEKSKGVTEVKSKVETISNKYEGLVCQMNNIKREIFNCKNVQLPNLERLEIIQPSLEDLGKRTDLREIEQLDQVELAQPENL
jgi:predicted  nucleic acid-binding Zn-ribbon protein